MNSEFQDSTDGKFETGSILSATNRRLWPPG